jgi:hypothetical protein
MSKRDEIPPLLRAFCEGRIDNAEFHHAQHVQVGFEMLKRHGFVEAATAFARGLRTIAGQAGRAQLYNETVTVAFLSMIAEAMQRCATFEELQRQAPELMRKDIIKTWYSPQRLSDPAARTVFLLPDRIGSFL